jgi:hypothetical protein
MKWLSVTSNSRVEVYELWNSKEKLLTVNYHPGNGALRLVADDERRIFLIDKEGFLRSRTVLRNEYGIRIGQLTYENNQENQGRIEIDDDDFNYVTQSALPPKAAVYKNNNMVTVCELPAASKSSDLLLLMLCWFISLAVTKQPHSHSVEEYA